MSLNWKKAGYLLLKTGFWFATSFVCVALILTLLLFVHLQQRPMNLMFLMPRIDSYLKTNYQLSLRSSSLRLSAKANKNGLFHISAKDLSLLDSAGGLIMDLPHVEISYGIHHILSLDYMPSNVKISDALLQLTLTKDGRLILEDQDETGSSMKNALPDAISVVDKEIKERADTLIKETIKTDTAKSKALASDMPTVADEAIIIKDANHFMQYLLQFRRLSLTDSSVVIQDLKTGKKISFPNVDFTLKRHRLTKYDIDIKTSLLLSGAEPMDFKLSADLNNTSKTMSFVLDFNRFNLSKVGGRISDLFKGFKLLLRGQLMGELDFSKKEDTIRKAVKKLSFAVQTTKQGSVYLPQPLDITYPIKNITAHGVFGDNLEQLFIRPIDASLTTGLTADVDIVINGIGAFLDSFDFNDITTTINSRMHNVPIEEVPNVWPAYLGPSAHAWVKENLKNGGATTALFTLYFTGAEITDLLGDVDFQNVDVNYLSPMPVIEKAGGKVMLYPDRVEIYANTGKIGNIELKIGNVYLTDLLDDVANAKIELDAQGPVPEILKLIDSKPLRLTSSFGVNPDKSSGEGHAQVTLHFPLTDTLQAQDVQVDVVAEVKNGSFEAPVDEVMIENADFDLTVNNEALLAKGRATVQDLPLQLQWDEYFVPAEHDNIKSVYSANGAISHEFLKPYWKDIDAYAEGSISFKTRAEIKANKSMQIELDANLKNTQVTMAPIAYQKEKSLPAGLLLNAVLDKNKQISKVSFDYTQEKQARVKGSYAKDQDGFKAVLDIVKTPTSSFSGKVVYHEDKDIDVRLKGTSWNLSQIKESPFVKNSLPNPQAEQQMPKEVVDSVNIFMDVSLDNLILTPDYPLKDVVLKIARTNNMWRSLLISGNGNAPLSIALDPQTGKLKGGTEDVGDLLLRLGFSDQFSKGSAKIKGRRLDNGGLTGELKLKELNLKEPGFIMQAVTILGIWDAISGQDLRFSDGKIPFDLSPNFTLFINEGVTYGTTLGVTFTGHIAYNALALTGSVIPAYMINSLPGKIPVIGMLFKDSQGGGLVGVKYEANGTPFNSRLSFNPLSSIAPGILGRIFK